MIYKVNITLESKMTELPNSSKIFGYIFSNILKNKKLKSNLEINEYLDNISDHKFNISNLMPAGYITNPTALYYINSVGEEYTEEKAVAQKKVKKQDYINIQHLKEHQNIVENKLYIQINSEYAEENYKSYTTQITQHVQINTLENNDYNPQPFNLQAIETKDSNFEFYIEFDDMFKEDIDQVLMVENEQLVILGAQSGKGYNLFSIAPNAVTICKASTRCDKHIMLGAYIVGHIDEIKMNIDANQFKLKNGSARPVKLPMPNDTRFRYFYIEEGSVLSIANSNIGKLLSYTKKFDNGYDPKIFGKPFAYPIGGLDEVK